MTIAIVLLITVLAQIIIPFSNGEYGVDRIESDLFSSSSKWLALLAFIDWFLLE